MSRPARHLVADLLALVLAVLAGAAVAASDATTCKGKFPNPITDICWSCVLPVSIGSAEIGNFDSQEDIENPSEVICNCNVRPIIGLSMGFWEPARLVEVVRKPFCLVTLGGVDMDPGIPAPSHGRTTRGGEEDGQGDGDAFYQAHFYTDPVLYWLEVLEDFPCLEKGSLDIAYITEVDPAWNDDPLSLILNPEAILFANPVAVAACAADCVAASTGFGIQTMFWCAGCQGVIYPMNGKVAVHGGGVRASELVMEKLTAKMHEELMTWGYHGTKGLCGPYFEPRMDKRAYKTQLLLPVTQTDKIAGRCCQPFGRTTMQWGAGREVPLVGEDFAYMLFRKRNCCIGYGF